MKPTCSSNIKGMAVYQHRTTTHDQPEMLKNPKPQPLGPESVLC